MTRALTASALIASCAGLLLAALPSLSPADDSSDRVFELRTYHCYEGKLPALNKRFRDHTVGLFKKHGIESVGYWMPVDAKDGKSNTLVYLLAYPSREAATQSWAAFRADPEWKKAQAESEKDGKIVEKAESVFLSPADYSMMK